MIAERLQNALLYVTDATRRLKTWTAIPGDSRESELLIAYVEEMPEAGDIVAWFCSGNGDAGEALFEKSAETVFAALKHLELKPSQAFIKVIVIRKADPGRRQINYERRLDVGSFFEAVKVWRAGQSNIPQIRIPILERGSGKIQSTPTPILFLNEAFSAFKTKWLRGADDKTEVYSLRLKDVFQLFLDPMPAIPRLELQLLRHCSSNWSEMLKTVGDKLQAGRMKDLSPESRAFALKAIPLLGLLLYRCGRNKEIYMKESAFNLGRMLGCANKLHLLYCEIVRKSDVPPQLIGTSLLSTAASNPAQALSLLLGRGRPYLAWAETYPYRANGEEGKGKIGLVKYFERELRESAEEFRRAGLPSRLSETDRAELLLGFLAGFEKKSNSNQQEESVQ